MNLCLLTSTFPADPGDSSHAFFLLQVIRVLERAGHQVSVLTQARCASHQPPLQNLDVVWFPWRRLDGRLAELSFGSPRALLSAASLVYGGTRSVQAMRHSRNIDAFLCAWVLPSGLYLYLDQLVNRSRTPFVLWALGSDVNKYKSNPIVRHALRRIAGRAGQVYADGFRLCRDLTQITGVDCQFLPTFRLLNRPDDRSARKTSGTQTRLLYVGRHTAVKGTDVLVEALGLLKRELAAPNYHMELVGDGDLTPDLKRRIAESGLGGQVTFRGQLSDQALASAYCAADCVVIPSRSESIPLVLSEALQFNRPLIVTDVGDMGDLVRRHQLGEVVPAGDARALAQSMRRFIAEPWRLDEAASADLLREWTFEGAAPKLLARLETLVRK